MDLTCIPDKLYCVVFSIKLVKRYVGYGEFVAHRQLGVGDVVLFFLGELGLVEVGVDELRKIVIDLVCRRLLFYVEPTYKRVHGSHVLHYELVFNVEEGSRVQLSENVFAHLHDVLRLYIGAVLKTENDKKEDIASGGHHLDSIYVGPSHFEKASNVFEDIDENESELIQRLVHASLIVDQFLFKIRNHKISLSLSQL